ncbi:unnamed protein product [Agarophyton chilense]
MAPPPVLDKLIGTKYSRKKSTATENRSDEPQPPANSHIKASIRRALGNAANRTFLTSTPKNHSPPDALNGTQDSSPITVLPPNPSSVDPARLDADDGTERHFDVNTDHAVGACSSAGWQLTPSATAGAPPVRSRKSNQDAYGVIAPFQHALFVGVYDGHGAYGRAVSQLVRDQVPQIVRDELRRAGESRSRNADDGRRSVVHAFTKAFSDAETSLRVCSPQIDHAFSGTTATCILMHAEQLYVAWAGDSRAVVATTEGNTLRAVDVSWDQKPNRVDEKKRVRLAGARVTRWKKNVGPQRVWLPNEWLPGLAMTRSIGDTVLSQYGVTTTPEVTVTRLGEREQFVVVASDGVWEFMSSADVVQLVDSMRRRGASAEDAARALVKEAARRWNAHEHVVDDITAVVVFLRGGGGGGTNSGGANGGSGERRERSIRDVLRVRRRSRLDGVPGVPLLVAPDGRVHAFDPQNKPADDDD